MQYSPSIAGFSVDHLISLDFFSDWLVGFKSTGSAFFQIKQKGVENYNIIKAICLIIAGRESKPIKADSAGCYQLSLTSRIDVQKVVDFFSSPNNHPLYGYKLSQYIIWLAALKTSSRYAQIIQL